MSHQLIDPDFAWVVRPQQLALDVGKKESLEEAVALAHERLDEAVAAVTRLLHKSGRAVDPDELSGRIDEVHRRTRVLSQITSLQVALGAAGKL